jgi:hypothetical protein
MHLGERENRGKGTRQIDSVTSGKREPCFKKAWYHKIGRGDCLLKTQDSAKWKHDV